MIGPEFEELGFFGCGASDGDADGPLGAGDLNRSDTYAAAGSGDEDEVSFDDVSRA